MRIEGRRHFARFSDWLGFAWLVRPIRSLALPAIAINGPFVTNVGKLYIFDLGGREQLA
jgi:hypothetical protein